jgi:branched-chain amino acid transport system permease protein
VDLALISGQQVMNMLTQSAILILVASGLTVVFGLMNIINFAHGALITAGAYCAAQMSEHAGSTWVGIPLAIVVGAALGLVADAIIMRRLYHRPWDSLLATIGLALVLIALATELFGQQAKDAKTPIRGQLDLGFTTYSAYQVFLIGAAIALVLLLAFVVRYTRLGLVARAVIANNELASGLGIDARKTRRYTFVVGCALAGLAGALVAPVSTVTPTMGESYLVPAFMVVVVSYASLRAFTFTCVLFGCADSWVTYIANPVIGSVTIIVLAAVILRLFPNGFVGMNAAGIVGRLRLLRATG